MLDLFVRLNYSILFSLFLILTCLSNTNANETVAHQVNLPIWDSPENKDFIYKNPGMYQSLQLSKSFYQFSHYSLQQIWGDNTTESLIAIILFDTIATWLPLSNSWLHEEWHRNILSQYGFDSRNGVYDFNWFSDVIAVDHVSDEDLALLKEKHPQDMIRLHSAGLESQALLNLSIEKDKFYNESKSFDYMLLWFNTINSLAYMNACSTSEANTITKNILDGEDENIDNRDFTGLDCNAWVYDLFRPEEPYSSRGTHPSGIGINRYITYDKLNNEEKRFLRKQYYLHFLNFINPFLLSMDNFHLPEKYSSRDILWNTNLQHFINPFGYSIHWNIFAKTPNHKLFFTFKNYFNKNSYFPGFVASLIDKPIATKTKLSIESNVWQQPEALSFTTNKGEWGGSLAASLKYQLNKYFILYSNISYKTKGWLEAYTSLDKDTYMQAGILINRFE